MAIEFYFTDQISVLHIFDDSGPFLPVVIFWTKLQKFSILRLSLVFFTRDSSTLNPGR